ncbi:MAG: hypothetical protein ACP5I8_12740, partial [Phycisphaerae bacterium]
MDSVTFDLESARRISAAVEEVEATVHDMGGRGRFITATSPPGTFPVLLEQNGGADGTQTSAATWTYNIYSVSDTGLANALATAIGPSPPRPNGSLKQQPSSVANTSYSYGLACNGAGGTVILLTAYEQPNT